jgi:hypothetical protein
MTTTRNGNSSLALLSRLLFPADQPTFSNDLRMNDEAFQELRELASSNHVIVRALGAYREMAISMGDRVRADWATIALNQENARIQTAVPFLAAVQDTLAAEGCDVLVIKTLDHWPDFGSDIDLYTDAEPKHVISVMQRNFNAHLAPRSWGDRLANKWNFMIRGLSEAIEIHMGRLGQTGEQAALAASLVARAKTVNIANFSFRVPCDEDRLMISTMQRMYRHFYFRLCDIVDSAGLVEADCLDYNRLQQHAEASGIWEGVATYLVIVSDYVESYRGRGLNLPAGVRNAARFGGDKIWFAREFLRVPVLGYATGLYTSELKTLALQRQFTNTARLCLLPCLASAAFLGQKITGSDKGIW